MNLPDDRSLFAVRAELKLLDAMRSLKGLMAVTNLEKSRWLNSLFGNYADASKKVVDALSDASLNDLDDVLIDLFWEEFADQVVLDETQSRLLIHAPESIKPAASTVTKLERKGRKSASLAYLKMAPYSIKGSNGNFFDDVVIFDLKPVQGMEDPLDLMPLSPFLTAGTTIRFYYPAAHHTRWYTFARKYQTPPAFKIDRRLEQLVHAQISPEVYCLTLGVDVVGSIKT